MIYGPEARPTFIDNEVCSNRESGIFVFAGAQPRVAQNVCYGNPFWFGGARSRQSSGVRSGMCHSNMLSGMLCSIMRPAALG